MIINGYNQILKKSPFLEENKIKNNHITDLDAIELSSAWNYNSNISINDEINVNGSMYNVINYINN